MKEELERRGSTNTNQIVFDKEDKEKFWVPVSRRNPDGKDGLRVGGHILCSLRLLPAKEAKKFRQGAGREGPNSDPRLPEPEGRIELTLNPFKMFNQLLGPAIRRKVCCCLCMLVCCALCTFMGPMIGSNAVSRILFGPH